MHCNTLQHTATLCNTLQYTATHAGMAFRDFDPTGSIRLGGTACITTEWVAETTMVCLLAPGSLSCEYRELSCRYTGLFFEYIGPFSEYTGLFCRYTGIFCRYTELFCGYAQLFCGRMGFFCGDTGLHSLSPGARSFCLLMACYGVATISRLLKTINLFCRIPSLL